MKWQNSRSFVEFVEHGNIDRRLIHLGKFHKLLPKKFTATA